MSKDSKWTAENGIRRGSTTKMVIQVGLFKLTRFCDTPMQGQQNSYWGAGYLQRVQVESERLDMWRLVTIHINNF